MLSYKHIRSTQLHPNQIMNILTYLFKRASSLGL